MAPDRAAETGAHGWNRLRWTLLVALLTRLLALGLWSDGLTDDRDGYLALADGVASGRGYSVPGSEVPTAYRPPLYPLLLLPSVFVSSGIWVAVLHLFLGVLTVWLTGRLAIGLTARADVAGVAAMLVAIDPILLRYSAMPMTETLATCLVTALLVVVAGPGSTTGHATGVRRSLATGVLFALAALCRPTVWAFAGLMALWSVATMIRRRVGWSPGEVEHLEDTRKGRNIWLTVGVAACLLCPWIVRNWQQFGRPILMTTHGGYTLLLGNNPHFFREVVDQPWGTVWDGSVGGGQSAWVDDLNRTMDEQDIEGEVDRDRWMRDRAMANILEDPAAFVRACWLRLRRFWGLMPIEGASEQSLWLRRTIGLFYGTTLAAAAWGMLTVARRRDGRWLPALLMIAGFVGVHLIYWTNIRMRAPIVPVIAVLSAVGWLQFCTWYRDAPGRDRERG